MTPGFYRGLLRILPRAFRDEYGEEMCRVAREHWEAVRKRTGWWGARLFWVRQSMALLREAIRLRGRDYETTGGMTMEGFLQDMKHAARALLRRPGFALVTVTTLGLGIGATTAMFSAVNTVLLRPLPYPDEEGLVQVFQSDRTTGERGDGVSAANTRDFHDAARQLSSVAFAEPWSMDLQVEGRAESLRTWAVSEGFFDALGTRTVAGRTFTEEEYQSGTEPVVVLGHGAWVTRFGADPGLVGQTLTLDDTPITVVGILPPDFRYPDAADLWIPRSGQPWDDNSRAADYMAGIGRLAPGATIEQAQAEADVISASLREAFPGANRALRFELVPLREHLLGDVRTPLLVIMGAVGFVLLIACANVAGLLLARGAQREREYALRGALGAGTSRLVGHVTAESLILAAAGCAVGIGLTYAGVWTIQALGPDHLPRIDQMRVDGQVLGFAAAAAALSAILSGFAPSLRLSRPDLRDALGDGARGSVGSSGSRMRSRLVVIEVAAAVVLLVGAGLLGRSFAVLLDEDLGFDPDDRLAVQVFAYGYSTDGTGLDRGTFVNQVVDEMEALPGVTGVALTTNLPSSNDGVIANIEITVPFTIVDQPAPPEGQEPNVSISQVTGKYFDVMGIDVLEGRAFTDADNSDALPIVIVNETLARRHFGSEDPIGESILIRFGQNPVAREIVGVVDDTRPLGHASDPVPEAYVPLSQMPSGSLTFVLRATSSAGALTFPAMQAIWNVNPSQSVWGATTVEALLAEWLKQRRFNLFLLSTFSVLALLLSAVGIYGLISFSVQRRLGELGIRRALGGQSGDLMGMVMREGAKLAGIGVAIGLTGAFFLSRFMQGMLYEIEPTDPMTFAGLAVLVLAIASAATFFPALRAMRVDPVVALRSE